MNIAKRACACVQFDKVAPARHVSVSILRSPAVIALASQPKQTNKRSKFFRVQLIFGIEKVCALVVLVAGPVWSRYIAFAGFMGFFISLSRKQFQRRKIIAKGVSEGHVSEGGCLTVPRREIFLKLARMCCVITKKKRPPHFYRIFEEK